MEVTESDLQDVAEMCVQFYDEEERNIISIVLYGGAAKNYVGQDHDPGDFDVNMFFSAQSAVPSTYGMPKKIGEHNGLKVEIMRNKIPEEIDVREYVLASDSKRWNRIRQEPAIQIYPTIKRVDWGE